MGGAQPLAATMQGAAALIVEIDESRIDKRLSTRYLDRKANGLDEAVDMITGAVRSGRAISVGLLGNAADVLPAMVASGVKPDVLKDQTSALDMLHRLVPAGMSLVEVIVY